MESSAPTGYLMIFDGPASHERVEAVVPPSAVRYYCRSGEMGSDDSIEWWTMEKPPEDESVEVTEYRLNPNQQPRTTDEGIAVLEYTCDDTKWDAPPRPPARGSTESQLRQALEDNPELAERLRAIEAQMAEPESIPRGSFAAEDICAVLVGDQWLEIPTPGKMLEIVLEPEGKVKLSIGANLIYKEANGEYVSIAPHAVGGFRFRPSSIAQKPEINQGVARISRDTYDAGGAEVQEMVAEAERVFVLEPDGEHTLVKDRDGVAE